MEGTLLKSETTRLDSELLTKAVIRLMKQNILERFIETGTLSEDDQEFCDKIEWYPIDELSLREEYIKKLQESSKKLDGMAMTAEEFNKWSNSL